MARPLPHVESITLKEEFYKIYRANGGFSYAAAKQVGVPYSTCHYWMNSDPNFKDITEEVKGTMLDMAEKELFQRATKFKDRDACLLFYMKTKGRERGYIERQETTSVGSDPLKLVVEYKTNEADVDLKARIIAEYEASKLDKPAE